MVNVFQRKNGKTYYFKLQVNGKQVFESTGEVNRNLAMKKATERIKELKGEGNYSEALKRLIDCINALPVDERDQVRGECIGKINEGTIFKVKLENAFEMYRERPKKRSVSEKTYQEYKSQWNNFILWINSEFPEIKYLNEITVDVAEKYLAYEWKKGIAENTHNYKIKRFRAMFTALSKKAGLFQNVWNSVDKKSDGSPISKKPLNPKQLNDLFDVAEGEMQTLFLIGLYTGLRRGDGATLKWNEIDFENGVIKRLPSKTKNLRKKIIIPMHKVLKAVLYQIKHNSIEENPSEYVLPKLSQVFLKNPTHLARLIRQTFEKAGIKTTVEREGAVRRTPVYGFHSFRHSFVSLCASGGIPAHVVMELVGHNSKTVHQIYQHATIQDKRKAIDLLPEIGGE